MTDAPAAESAASSDDKKLRQSDAGDGAEANGDSADGPSSSALHELSNDADKEAGAASSKTEDWADDAKAVLGTAHTTDPRIRCRCGCVPNVPSLFEMAELRKKHREDQARKAAAGSKAKRLQPSSPPVVLLPGALR